jgi:hypothetical protein
MIRYKVRICDDTGVTQAIPRDFQSCRYVLRADGEIGVCEMVLPRRKYEDMLKVSNPDWRIQIWRSVNGLTYTLDGDMEYFILDWDTTDDTIKVTAPSLQHLLTRRINAYYAGLQDTPSRVGAIYAGPVLNIMCDVFEANFIGINPERDVLTLPYYPAGFQINYKSGGPSLNITCSRENVFDILKKMAEASFTQGRWAVGLVRSNGQTWRFDAHLDFAGVDRRRTLVLSPELANVQNVVLSENAIDRKSAVIAAGRGTGKARSLNIQIDTNRVNSSIIGYNELFAEDTNARDNQIINVARAALRKHRIITEFSCDLTQSPNTVRGIHYDVGDYLRVKYLRKNLDMRLDVVEVTLTGTTGVERARLTQ